MQFSKAPYDEFSTLISPAGQMGEQIKNGWQKSHELRLNVDFQETKVGVSLQILIKLQNVGEQFLVFLQKVNGTAVEIYGIIQSNDDCFPKS